MRTISRAMTMTLGAGIFAVVFAAQATADCGDLSGFNGPFKYAPEGAMASLLAQASTAAAQSRGGSSSASIVGMWKVQFISEGNSNRNPPIGNGAIVDFGYSQWHSDGTEIMNSGGHAPATQNFCLGVWGQTGFLTYELNHFAISYDPSTGDVAANVNIRENVSLSPSGDVYTGTFTIDVYDPSGDHVDHIVGNVTGQRMTVDTTLP